MSNVPQFNPSACVDLDIEAIEARLSLLTSDDWSGYADDEGDNAGRCELFSGPWGNGYRTGSVFAVRSDCECGCYPPSPAEMRFIECARQDVPALVAEVRRLRGELERHKAPTGDAEIDALLAKCKRNAGSKGYRVAAYALRSLAAARAEAERLREEWEACEERLSSTRLWMAEENADLKVEAARVREALQAIREWAEGDYGGAKRPIDVWPGLRRVLDAALDGAEVRTEGASECGPDD